VHPNIVRTLDVFRSSGRLCLAMEWADGGSLEALLDARGTRQRISPVGTRVARANPARARSGQDEQEPTMPMPRLMARLNRAGVNRLLRRIAPRMPGLGVVVHRGRRSGRTYRTPVAVVPTSTGPVIGLFYGSQSDWVKNVLAAGELELLTTGRTLHFGSPRIYHDESRAGFGVVPRQILRLFRVSDFLALDSTSSSTAPGAQPPG